VKGSNFHICTLSNIEYVHHTVGKMDASPSMSKVLQDLTNTYLLSSTKIQPLVGGKENNMVWQSIELLPISSLGETITPNGMNIGDDELSKLTCEICF